MTLMIRCAIVAIAALCLALPTPAVTIDPTPDVTTFASPESKEDRPAEFKLHLVVTGSDEQLREWLSDVDRRDQLQTRTFKPRQRGHAALVLTEYDLKGFDAVDLEAEVRLYGPDGKLIYTHPDLARSAWGQPRKGYLALLPRVEFSFDERDAIGAYTYEAVVRDRSTNEVARASFEIELVQ